MFLNLTRGEMFKYDWLGIKSNPRATTFWETFWLKICPYQDLVRHHPYTYYALLTTILTSPKLFSKVRLFASQWPPLPLAYAT